MRPDVCPGDGDALRAVERAFYPRDLAVDDGLKLHCIEAPPMPLFPVIVDGTGLSRIQDMEPSSPLDRISLCESEAHHNPLARQ